MNVSLAGPGPLALVDAALRDVPGQQPSDRIVCVGDAVDTDSQDNLLRGHGTRGLGELLVATTCGVVERVNKLVTVRPLQSRYTPDVGDVVVGRVTEVAGNRWKLDVGAKQDATLLLSAVNLPGGVQRRRTVEDELNMRSVYQEGDLISAEVQAVHHDGSVMLHTRSRKYGKLQQGQIVSVPVNLIRRQKEHFRALTDLGVDAIIGCNGCVWLAAHQHQPDPAVAAQQASEALELGCAPLLPKPAPEARAGTSRTAQAVRALVQLRLEVHPAAIQSVAQRSLEEGTPVRDMLSGAFLGTLAGYEAQCRLASAQ